MSMGGPLREIVVVGGGLAGWSAAAALKRRVPALDVTILPLAPPADTLTDRIPCTLPSIRGFHADLGIGEEDAVLRTGSACRLGTLFAGWSAGLPDYVHAYGPHGAPVAGQSFHLHWARAARDGGADAFDSFSTAAALARLGRFAPASDGPHDPASGYQYGLTLDLPAYARMLRAFAQHCGVIEQAHGLRDVRLRGDGWIDALLLDDGSEVRGHLFLDCTGPQALLRSKIDDARDDWRRWMASDRVLFGAASRAERPSPLDRVTTWEAGWLWSTGAQGSQGLVYASGHADDAAAEHVLHDAGATAIGAPVGFDPGTRRAPWRGNCVAIGEATTVIEPLEWTPLHLAHSAIDRLIAMLPDQACTAVEAADYNRQHVAEAERVRDFVVLHYATAKRPEPFWRARAAAALPDSLAHTLSLFRERGRLPVYQEDTFDRDSWLAVLIGQGELPRRIDPLVEGVPAAESRAVMARRRQAVAAAASSRPTLAAWLGAQHRQLAR